MNQHRSFIIIGTQRTGSSMIAAMLNGHPRINCGWEWALQMPPVGKIDRTMAGLRGNFAALPPPHNLEMQQHEAEIIGFRLLFSSSPKWLFTPRYSLAHFWERLNPFLHCIRRHPEIKIIHITRKQNLDWLASLFMAKASKLYINKEYPKIRINIPLNEAKKRLQAKRFLEEQAKTLENTNPYWEISYEEIIADMEQSFTDLFHFLKVDPPDPIPTPSLKKQQKRSLDQVIINYQRLYQYISQGS